MPRIPLMIQSRRAVVSNFYSKQLREITMYPPTGETLLIISSTRLDPRNCFVTKVLASRREMNK